MLIIFYTPSLEIIMITTNEKIKENTVHIYMNRFPVTT
ncbi:hypothetical protein BAXH7_02985 [Bacillus amyloliquefaciens XH7]|nr:hypothetical protein BAXH7_02985 [Bacillus amyloliquefaciens XH7]QBG57423.1 hypothetical protein D2M30_3097 [Bacillus amyloliquefaciens]